MIRSKRVAAGYTLVEILIVIFIISIVTTVALLSISHNENRQIESFAKELTQTVTLAEEQAMLQPSVLGLSFNEQSFQFASFKQQEGKKSLWLPLSDKLLGKHFIPNNIQVDVEVGAIASKQSETDVTSDEDKNTNKLPQIIISTNGDITPFTIYVGQKGEKPRYKITGDANGNVTNQLLS